jgi:hypothetical protein
MFCILFLKIILHFWKPFFFYMLFFYTFLKNFFKIFLYMFLKNTTIFVKPPYNFYALFQKPPSWSVNFLRCNRWVYPKVLLII